MPAAEPERAVVWRLGEALLAAPLDAVQEVASVTKDGRARTRSGELEPLVPNGLEVPRPSRRAVVLLVGDRGVAVAADEVEGVAEVPESMAVAPSEWLGQLDTRHVRAVVRLVDGRLAALLEPDALLSG